MLKHILLALVFAMIAACGGGSDNPPATTTTPTAETQTPPGTETTTPPAEVGTPGAPTGDTAGTWQGETDFGNGVYVIDANQTLHGLSDNGAGQYKVLHGKITEAIARFDHRISDDPAIGNGITIVGTVDEQFAFTAYTFAANDNGTLFNSSNLGDFTMTRVPSNPITIAEVTGNWITRTAFCAPTPELTCPITVSLTIGADGALSGFVDASEAQTDPTARLGIVGTVAEQGDYLSVTFTWNKLTRTGVIYREIGGANLVLNTVGPKTANPGDVDMESFTGIFSQGQ